MSGAPLGAGPLGAGPGSPGPGTGGLAGGGDDQPFPRGRAVPQQSPQFWVQEKDRYLRQLMIRDIMELTGRALVVSFQAPDAPFEVMMDRRDADDIAEILDEYPRDLPVDLFLVTPGGDVDACEKLISVLNQRCGSFRCIVPNQAKSSGTVVALAASEIVMGPNSELGPIDPQIGRFPAELVARDPDQSFAIRELAQDAIARMTLLAHTALARAQPDQPLWHDRAARVVQRLASREIWRSHNAVIDAPEAERLGLPVLRLDADAPLWRRLWLLYCMYEHDCATRGYVKLFEGRRNSRPRIPLRATP